MNALLLHPKFPEPYRSLYKLLGARAYVPPLGLVTVAALLPSHWSFRLVDLVCSEISERDWSECDVVLITGMAVQEEHIVELIHEARRRRKIVVVGGPWVYHFPEKALEEGAHLVVRGEAERVIEVLIEKLRNREFGLIISSGERTLMEKVPVPRFDLLNMDNYLTMAVQFSRGCPHKCEFCDVTNMLGRQVRTKTAEQMITELEQLRTLGWRGQVFFVDDNFAGMPVRTRALLRHIIRWQKDRHHAFEYGTQVSITAALDDELLALMRAAGFWKACIGFESTDQDTLRGADKVQNTLLDFDLTCRRFNDAGILVMATFMIGFDGEAAGVDRHIIDFAVRNRIAEVQVFPLRASPGTALWDRLQSKGRLLETTGKSLGNQTVLVNFAPTRPLNEIVAELLHVNQEICEPGAFLERAADQISRLGDGAASSSSPRFTRQARLAVGRALWLQGVVYDSRLIFWRLFLRMLKQKKLGMFLRYSIIGGCYFEFGKTVVALLKDQVKGAGKAFNAQ